MPAYDPNDIKRTGANVPTNSVTANGGGMPTLPKPPPVQQVPNAPIARSRRDSVVRPIAQPGQAFAQAPTPTPPTQSPVLAPGQIPGEQLTAPQAPGLAPPPPPPSQAGLEAQAGQPAPAPAQPGAAQQPEGEKPDLVKNQEAAQAQQAAVDAQPSPVQGLPMGQYNKMLKESVPGKEGSPKAQAAFQRQAREFGNNPYANDPSAPQPKLNVAGRNFNPFTGGFTTLPYGPSAIKMAGQDMGQLMKEYFSKQQGQ
jgi:hypothetical protein